MKKSLRLAGALTISLLAGVFIMTHATVPASAASVGPGQCVQSNPTECQSDPSHGGNPNAQGAQGGSGAAQGTACDSFNALNSGISCDASGNGSAGQSAIGSIAGNIVNVLSYIAGFAAVVLIIVAGFRYATSGGDPNGAGAAKNALVGAVIGLAVAAIAQALVHFVLNHTSG